MRRTRSLVLPSLALVVALLASGCGVERAVSEAIGQGIRNLFTGLPVRDIEGIVTRDGHVVQDDWLLVGDDAAQDSLRSTFGFSLPSDDVIEAKLTLHLDFAVGMPIAKLGGVYLERVDLGATLDAGDYDSPALGSQLILSDTPVGPVEIDVTDMVYGAKASGASHIHFRLRLAAEASADFAPDQIAFSSRAKGADPTKPNLIFRFPPTP